MCVQADFADKRCLTRSKVEFVSRDDPLSRTSHSLLFERPQPYLLSFFSCLRWAPRRRPVHVYAGSKVAAERRMDHALCIIHHVIGSLSDSTPCRCYRCTTARHGLVKHKHRETINKRNVARIPRTTVSLCPLKPDRGKMSSPSSLSFLPREFSPVSVSRIVLVATPFRSDFVSWFTRVTPSTLDHGSVVGCFPSNSRAPSKGQTEPPLFDSTPRPITYAYPGTPMVILLHALPILRQIV